MQATGSSDFARNDLHNHDIPPTINVCYFYTSSLNIDDKLAPVPDVSTKELFCRPLASPDNLALEKAWFKSSRKVKLENQHLVGKSGKSQEARLSGDLVDTGNHQSWDDGNQVERSRESDSKLITGTREMTVGSADTVQHDKYARDSQSRKAPNTASVEMPIEDLPYVKSEGTTGTPFVRAESTGIRRGKAPDDDKFSSSQDKYEKQLEYFSDPAVTSTVPVGISKLHEVILPDLCLSPIYWRTMNDTVPVVRGTWFYQDGMRPLEPIVANLLEVGYLKLRPWTQTWRDELNSAVKVGAIGEEKIIHRLWPTHAVDRRERGRGTASAGYSSVKGKMSTPNGQETALLNAALGSLDKLKEQVGMDNKSVGSLAPTNQGQSLYQSSAVLYVDDDKAVILRPSLAPSAYFGRRPLANYIRKGRRIGISVVRGFKRELWASSNQDSRNIQITGSETLSDPTKMRHSSALKSPDDLMQDQIQGDVNPHVRDLIFVIHGIGQKLSEKVESYNFTRVVDGLRREINIESESKVFSQTRKDQPPSIIALPINWRSQLSFEDSEFEAKRNDPTFNTYTLDDITPTTLPSVRAIVRDVMVDIPYYLSHHQQSMIRAVVDEANRIYGLWCKNNPHFNGRVHLVAHSLGSVMALDILSQQPTTVNSISAKAESRHFKFNTTNLFLCGSPAGFFLFLQKASLRPRQDNTNKRSELRNVQSTGIGANQGSYGCLAVQNIYNIINPFDPVAYHLNASVDSKWASTLKPAFVPSASASWLSIGSLFASNSNSNTFVGAARPGLAQRLPSNVEMETHDFTREEIAQERAFLLNDNGQIDYILNFNGTSFGFQYVAMLGAHSSYWISKDFARLLVTETLRGSGRAETLPAMRAIKKASI